MSNDANAFCPLALVAHPPISAEAVNSSLLSEIEGTLSATPYASVVAANLIGSIEGNAFLFAGIGGTSCISAEAVNHGLTLAECRQMKDSLVALNDRACPAVISDCCRRCVLFSLVFLRQVLVARTFDETRGRAFMMS